MQTWISVKDKLPVMMETKLLWVPFYRNTTTGYYNGSEFVKHNDNAIGEVTHWSELPEPPNEK